MKRSIAAVVLTAGLIFSGGALAQTLDKVVKVGSLGDQSGLYQDIGGPGSSVAAQMAIEDSGLLAKGWKIGLISGDHQNKPDVGSASPSSGSTSTRSMCWSISPVPASASRSPTSPRSATSSI
jgi:hypothetical protein